MSYQESQEAKKEFAKRVVSFLPFAPCRCTLKVLAHDLGLRGAGEIRHVREAFEFCRSMGVKVVEGQHGHEKHYWISDPTSKKRARAIADEVMEQEETITAVA